METRITKIVWAVGGAIIGSIVSVLVDKVVLPYFEGKPNIEVLAEHHEPGRTKFAIYNSGSAEVSNVWLSARLADQYRSPVDILSVDHNEDDIGAKCGYQIVNSIFRSRNQESIRTVLNTESSSLQITCKLLNPGETWSAQLVHKPKQNVSGVLVHVTYPGMSEHLYAILTGS